MRIPFCSTARFRAALISTRVEAKAHPEVNNQPVEFAFFQILKSKEVAACALGETVREVRKSLQVAIEENRGASMVADLKKILKAGKIAARGMRHNYQGG